MIWLIFDENNAGKDDSSSHSFFMFLKRMKWQDECDSVLVFFFFLKNLFIPGIHLLHNVNRIVLTFVFLPRRFV